LLLPSLFPIPAALHPLALLGFSFPQTQSTEFKEKIEREIKNVDLNYINHILELASNFYDIELFKKTYNDEYKYISYYRKFKDLINNQ
jgi:hypothetical protein